ncbi:pyrimidine-nucleoside phosphorylase [Schleiferilactobacillus perolens]|uniref:Pyrimidine-nucleoside phosphorylase n=1 Tax=Schleiferilactobacillus perolens DSM 12744 TaxID=1423792 RepID=A0A0R1N6U5_9LACO|nr:pyrimidine-nucleoside phosphorylase [Schleiferilactobacillus perolens]KRL12523.1 pyrimidine-nucleoside phosphorylase [Schleiferilactobacillus perolens DSM 12744]
MRMVDIIQAKRDGQELTKEQIDFVIDGYTQGTIPDYQMSAWLMAIYFQNMTPLEISVLTDAMLHSGDVLNLAKIPGIKVDKHSTGGVGDKISIPLAPLVAAAGAKNPMISGRGLGHTGGTLDKLEAIPGFNVDLTEEQFIQQVTTIGTAITSATGNLAPADKKIYALRDVTGTVEAIPLISSSIMSKKLASGTDGLVLDVKTGNGAFMKTEARATELAEALVRIGHQAGIKIVALLTDMSQPLGYAIGNALEIAESIDVLKNKGPADVRELTLTLGAHMLIQAEIAEDLPTARRILENRLADGSALAKFKEMITAQGGDASIVDHPTKMPQANHTIPVLAPKAGVVDQMATDRLGVASMILGGGRQKKGDVVDHAVGLVLHKKIGDKVAHGELLATIYAEEPARPDVVDMVLAAIHIGDNATAPKLIHHIIQ